MKFSDYEYKRPDFDAIVAKYNELSEKVKGAKSLDEVVDAVEMHEKTLADFATAQMLAEIRHTVDTRDAFYNEENEVITAQSPACIEAQSRFLMELLKSPFKPELEKKYPKVVFTNAEMEVKTISSEVVELLAQEGALELEYQKLVASAKIDFRGKTYTIAQLGVFKTDSDRETRREAYNADGTFYSEHRAEFDELYDKLVKIRTKIAHKLGFPSFVELAYCRRTRNCYDAQMVKNFRNEVKKHLVPLVAKLKAEQAKRIGVDEIKIYDDGVLFKDGNPRPVGTNDDTYNAGVELYREMRPETRDFINYMHEHELFSLVATEGKAAGGYCTFVYKYRSPFIFSNFNGTAGDVEVFTHEGGHAFAAYVADKNVKMIEAGSPTMESCEVHSMSMEFLAWPWLETFYGERTDEAKYAHLLGALDFIPYGCMVDEFQHIVYENPDFTPQQRADAWKKLIEEYKPYLADSGLPFYSDGRHWQRQLHIYLYPFYYIDYCLAQSVSLEIFALMQDKGWDAAWEHYYAFLEKAGTKTFVELLEGAGLSNPFKSGAMEFICKVVNDYISK